MAATHATQELNDQQRIFVQYYLEDLNAFRAAEKAGYASPRQKGPRLVKNSPSVRKAIQEAMDERCERLGINNQYVLAELLDALQIAKANVKPKLNSKTGKPIVSEDGSPIYVRNEPAVAKYLELIGKHTKVSAFDNKVDITVRRDQDLIEAIEAGKRQAGIEDKSND